MMKVLLIAGARPNFMKIAPIYRASQKNASVICKIVHTGQHYDFEMSQAFFEDLELPEPDYFLDVGSGSHAVQTAHVMVAFEQVCIKEIPDLVIVVGDVNSTMACTIVAKKLFYTVAHIEAGLRSFDLTMPEEINRIITDSVADYHFVTEESAIFNLQQEGKPGERIFFVGNVMIDNLYYQLKKIHEAEDNHFKTKTMKGKLSKYIFLTLHRPSNVDDKNVLADIIAALNIIAHDMPIIFPVHPRTQKMIKKFNIKLSEHIYQLPPLSFREALFLWKDSFMVLTDSGGLQEETTALGIPCLTLRKNTERPITVKTGTNILAGTTKVSILNAYRNYNEMKTTSIVIPKKWDGKASERIWDNILNVTKLNDGKTALI